MEIMLGSVGLSKTEEAAYLLLLDRGSASLEELAAAATSTPARARRLVRSLLDKGLIHHTPPPEDRIIPVPPDLVVDQLIRRRHEEFEKVRIAAYRLAEETRARADGRRADQLIEVVSGNRAVGQAFDRLQRAAQQEMRVLVAPPYAVPKAVNENQLDRLLNAGVTCRAVYDTTALADPAIAEGAAACVRAGEQARLSDQVPLKLAIADHNLALLPLTWTQAANDTALLIRPCGLLGAVSALFDMVWNHAVPLFLTSADEFSAVSSLPEDDGYLLSLLVSGLTDDAVAARLGVSRRTVTRRVTHLMEQAGARSRLQLGWKARERGWL
ncbi:helix-turn-helix domain-containing protein [Streptomyces albogriseolus]|uniref:helix-turn-helix domain-containing protein n=1 Tax=Streptomyces albogriseolus TaxID=1887 RepID=UPI0037945EA5